MHEQAVNFTLFVKKHLPEYFTGKIVFDIGSGDINGNNRRLFTDCVYGGNDVFPAKNVTIVSKTSVLPYASGVCDTIVSTECFEHDPEHIESFKKIIDMLKPGGLFLFTCASTGRPEHGTRRTTPQDSYGTIGNVEGWSDYYKNLTIEDLDTAVDINKTFSSYASYYCSSPCDMYFWGIKHGNLRKDIPVYSAHATSLVRSI